MDGSGGRRSVKSAFPEFYLAGIFHASQGEKKRGGGGEGRDSD